MKKTLMHKVMLVILLFLSQPLYLFAECYNEDTCYKDYVNTKDQNVVIAVNRDTSDVELYWSEKDNTWLKPDAEYQKGLQKIYGRKLQLQAMQARLNKMRSDTWFNTNQGGSGRQ